MLYIYISTLKFSNVYNLKNFYERFMKQNLQSRSLKGQDRATRFSTSGFFMNWGKMIHGENLKQKISWHCPFNMHLMCSLSGDVYSACVAFLVTYFQ